MTGSTAPWQAVADAIAEPTGPYLSCDDCFERVDEEIDAALAAGVGPRSDFLTHMRTCAACRHEARTLLELAVEDRGVDPSASIATFDAALREWAPRGSNPQPTVLSHSQVGECSVLEFPGFSAGRKSRRAC